MNTATFQGLTPGRSTTELPPLGGSRAFTPVQTPEGDSHEVGGRGLEPPDLRFHLLVGTNSQASTRIFLHQDRPYVSVNQGKSRHPLSDRVARCWEQADGHQRSIPRRIWLVDSNVWNVEFSELLEDLVQVKLVLGCQGDGARAFGQVASAAFSSSVNRLSDHHPCGEVGSNYHVVVERLSRGACGTIGRPLDSLTVMLDSS